MDTGLLYPLLNVHKGGGDHPWQIILLVPCRVSPIVLLGSKLIRCCRQSLTRVPQALSVAPSLRLRGYNQGPSGTLNTVVPSEAAPNYYVARSLGLRPNYNLVHF